MEQANLNFLQFSKPFLDALKETFTMMVQCNLTTHSPSVKSSTTAKGDITALIGMNGLLETNGEDKPFKGLMAISWPEEVYIKMASKMLMEEYTEFNSEIADSGAEIVNIVMGNAKAQLANQGFKIEMATPSTVKGKDHELKYPTNTTVIEITCSSECGDFVLEICYQEN